MGRLLALALGLTACGRIEFGQQTELACGTPARFTTGETSAGALVGIAMSGGYDVFLTDGNGHLLGWQLTLSHGMLGIAASAVMLDSNANGQLGVAGSGSAVMLSSMVGRPTATGTTLYSLSAGLGARSPASTRNGELVASSPIAPAATGGDFALVSMASSGAVAANAVSNAGVDLGMPVPIASSAAKASTVAIAAIDGGYAVAYSSAAGSPRRIVVQLLDENLNTTFGPVNVDPGKYDAYSPVIAEALGVYFVGWHMKNAVGGDDVTFALLDASLQPLVGPTLLAASSHNATVASDGAGFWVAYDTYTPSDHMDAARVASNGAITPRPVVGSGGKPVKWTMIANGIQPVLAWIESGGSGPDLYLDPMCSP